MKREIEFRGMNKDGLWVYGSYHHSADGQNHYILALEKFNSRLGDEEALHSKEVFDVRSDTVGQYLGFEDYCLNEHYKPKRVFEGDKAILRSIHVGIPHEGREGVIVFREGAFWLDFGDSAVLAWSDAYFLTVTGNIHESGGGE